MEGGGGFEPPVGGTSTYNGFGDRRFKPLSHPPIKVPLKGCAQTGKSQSVPGGAPTPSGFGAGPLARACPSTSILSRETEMNNDQKEAAPQEPPKIDMKALDVVVKKVLNYGPAKANRQSETGK